MLVSKSCRFQWCYHRFLASAGTFLENSMNCFYSNQCCPRHDASAPSKPKSSAHRAARTYRQFRVCSNVSLRQKSLLGILERLSQGRGRRTRKHRPQFVGALWLRVHGRKKTTSSARLAQERYTTSVFEARSFLYGFKAHVVRQTQTVLYCRNNVDIQTLETMLQSL